MRGRSAGFTLVEVLVAVFVITLVLLAVAPMFLYAARANAGSADLGSCAALAMERMELLRTEDFQSLAVGGSLLADVAGYVDASHPGYLVRWSISDAAAPAGALRIAVRAASLRETVGLKKQSTLITLRAR